MSGGRTPLLMNDFTPCVWHCREYDIKETSNKEILEKLDNLTKVVNEKDQVINKLAEKIEKLEKKINHNNEVHEQSSEIEKEIVEKEVMEEISKEKEKEVFKCSKCKFETIHENGLKIHKKRKHIKASKTCDLCDKKFETVREM